jgi:hypothetical protein
MVAVSLLILQPLVFGVWIISNNINICIQFNITHCNMALRLRLPLAAFGRRRQTPLSWTLIEAVMSSSLLSSSSIYMSLSISAQQLACKVEWCALCTAVPVIRWSDLVETLVQLITVDTEVKGLLWSARNTLFFLNHCNILSTLPFYLASFLPQKRFWKKSLKIQRSRHDPLIERETAYPSGIPEFNHGFRVASLVTSPLKGVNPAGTPGYRNGTESFFGLKWCPSVVRDVEIYNQPVLRMRRK